MIGRWMGPLIAQLGCHWSTLVTRSQSRKGRGGIPCWRSVSELVDVVEESVERVGCIIAIAAVVGALAGLDHHDVLVEGVAILAAEFDTDGAGLLWTAAAAIHA